ncbi:MAG: hypothetical protein R2810_11725 [Flavobacteriales bacterium]
MVPVEVPPAQGRSVPFTEDEGIQERQLRQDSHAAPVFDKEGTVTAASAST